MSSTSETLRILLYSDDGEQHPVIRGTPDPYDLVMQVNVAESPWEQVKEMLTEAGVKISRYSKSSISVVIEGTLGLKSVAYAKDLAAHCTVTWYIDGASVASVRSVLGPLAIVAPLPAPTGKTS